MKWLLRMFIKIKPFGIVIAFSIFSIGIILWYALSLPEGYFESTYFGASIFVALGLTILLTTKMPELQETPAIHISVSVFFVMAGGLFIVIFGGNNDNMFEKLLGNEIKQQFIEFVAFGIIGTLAAINAIVINRRARAQEKKNDDYRFQHLVNDLGHAKTSVRVASFHRFYYLASKGKGEKAIKLSKDVFEILCSHLRVISSKHPCTLKEKYEHLTESQILFDVLFKEKFRSKDPELCLIQDGIKPDLRNIYFADIDVSNANLSGVDFRKAQFKNVNLKKVRCVDRADFRGATINGEQALIKHFPEGARCYTQDNHPDSRQLVLFYYLE